MGRASSSMFQTKECSTASYATPRLSRLLSLPALCSCSRLVRSLGMSPVDELLAQRLVRRPLVRECEAPCGAIQRLRPYASAI